MDSVLEPLLLRHDLPQLIESLNKQFEQERIDRERFLQELTPNMKAEFIAGKQILHSPAKAEHIRVVGRIYKLISTYVSNAGLGEVFYEKALVHLTRNDYEPDVLFYGSTKAASITPDLLLFPAPDFIVEVLSETTESRDRGVKFIDYAAHGVAEYWIVDAFEQFVEQYLLSGKEYKLSQKLKSGLIVCEAIPSLEIPVAALFNEAAHRDAMRELYRN